MDNSNDWTRFYSSTTDSTVISTGPIPVQPQPVHNIEGRVGKSARKRTRASRRAPTTLLNTDPTNFRAMVQQFTGAPTGPYPNPSQTGPVISFGQAGQYHGQQYAGGVILPGGNVSDMGFVSQGFSSGGSSVINSASGGLFFDGTMGGNNNNWSGGHLF